MKQLYNRSTLHISHCYVSTVHIWTTCLHDKRLQTNPAQSDPVIIFPSIRSLLLANPPNVC